MVTEECRRRWLLYIVPTLKQKSQVVCFNFFFDFRGGTVTCDETHARRWKSVAPCAACHHTWSRARFPRRSSVWTHAFLIISFHASCKTNFEVRCQEWSTAPWQQASRWRWSRRRHGKTSAEKAVKIWSCARSFEDSTKCHHMPYGSYHSILLEHLDVPKWPLLQKHQPWGSKLHRLVQKGVHFSPVESQELNSSFNAIMDRQPFVISLILFFFLCFTRLSFVIFATLIHTLKIL